MMRETTRSAVLGLLAAVLMALAIVVPAAPALACSCAVTTTEESAEIATLAFVGTEIGRVDTNSREVESVLVTFAVDQWLSHDEGPKEFQAFTGSGGGDCGIGPLGGQVAVFVYGSAEDPNINICGSIQPIGDAIDAFAGRAISVFPIPFDDTPAAEPGGSSYADLVLPIAGLALVAAGGVWLFRRRDDQSTDQMP